MEEAELLDIIENGETNRVQFKREFDNQEKIAAEMIAMANSQGGMIHVDGMIVADTSIADIDKDKVNNYVKQLLPNSIDTVSIPENVLYQNLDIIKKSNLTLGGLLFFGKEPQLHKPTFCVKAISFVGNSIGGSAFRDSRNIVGTIPDLFKEGILFFKQNLKYVQREQNFNYPGVIEISEIALEELFQNALIHRDYIKNAPIRLMIFDDRVEIVSPGSLPNSLTVDSIKLGNAAVRNNLLASYASNSKLMKYRGFGSGIIRAIEEQPNIEFINDADGQQFIVKIPREPMV